MHSRSSIHRSSSMYQEERPVSRVQLALNVSDLGSAIDFYTKLFREPPAKVRDGYANFAIADPPLKLVLIEGGGAPGSLNHLGVEVASTAAVRDAGDRFAQVGLQPTPADELTSSYPLQPKLSV